MVQVEIAKVSYSGKSLCLHLRKQVRAWLGVRHGDVVTFRQFEGGVYLAKLNPGKLPDVVRDQEKVEGHR